MLIYYAGNALIAWREDAIRAANCQRLFSFYHHNDEGMAWMDFKYWCDLIDALNGDTTCKGSLSRKKK